ncbi:MAG TPA: hypothetical protein EYP31_00995 [Roseibacterium sp.]|nr:hypothetical protein [Roseibacterium sp.]
MGAFVILLGFQSGPTLLLVFSDGVADVFDWAGFTGYSLGSVFIPMVFGCLGLLFRRNRGAGFFVVSFLVFFTAEIGRLAT